MLRSTDLIDLLQRLGIERGSMLLFEAPSLGIEDVGGGAEGLLAALQDLVGTEGTLVVPTCTPAEGYPKPTFDPILSLSEMGPFSEFFRKQAGVLRSHSPTHSIAALGPLAEKLVAGHRLALGRPTPWGEGPFGLGSPWDLLYERNAWWVSVNPNWQDTPFVSYVQALYAGRCRGITKNTPFARFKTAQLGATLGQLGVLHQANWGAWPVVVFRLHCAVDMALQVLEENPDQFEPDAEFRAWLARVDDIRRNGHLKAGVAKVKITPPLPALRWEGKPFSGVYRDLYARVVVLSRGEQRLALVLCDLLGISGDLVREIRRQVHGTIGLAPEAIQIACTHSHSTPDTIGSGYEDESYIRFMVDTISAAISDAATTMQPVRLGWGRVPIRGLAHSRRKKMTDGRVFTTRYGVPSTWRVKPELIVGEGRIDPDLTVVRLEDLDGEVLAVISNFGCHASVALMSPNISGDFPGEAMATLESVLGERSVALCTNGAAADVDPTLEMPYWGPRNDAMATRLGRIYAAQVLECLERVEVEDIATLGVAQETVDLEVREDWVHLLETEQARMRQEFADGWALSPATTRALEERVIHSEVQALRLNDLVLLGFPGEIFAQMGLQLKAGDQQVAVAVVELANDNVGYIPTQEIFEEGGYEVGQHLWGRVTPAATRSLMAAARRAIDRVTETDAAARIMPDDGGGCG
jgi:neutral ceramidase